jgi:tetratricopeptide (TPR) repeat protein
MKKAEEKPADPYSVRVISLYGECLCRLDKTPEAFERISPLLERSPALRTRFWLPAAAELVQQEASARAWIERVRPLLDRADEADTIALANAYAGVGRRFENTRANMFEAALRTLSTFAESKGDPSAKLLECLGFVQQGLSRNKEAEVSFRQALEKDPKAVFALRGLAEISLADRPVDAVNYARKALEASGGGDVQGKALLGTTLLASSAKKRESNDVAGAVAAANEAVQLFDAVLASQPANGLVMMQAIAALDAADRQKETLPRYDALLSLPRSALPPGLTGPMLQNNYAYALLRTGATGVDLARARTFAVQATEQLRSAATFDTLGQIELVRGDKKAATAAFRTAVELDLTSYSSMVGLAEAMLIAPASDDDVAAARKLLDELDKKGSVVPTSLQDKVSALRRKLP